jgi:putative hydrolase of the HAD superfamily
MIIASLQSQNKIIMNKAVKNIVFDLGGVLLDIDYTKTIAAFRKLGLANPSKAFSQYSQGGLFKEFEKGLISDKDFLERLQKHMPGADILAVEEAWCALLGAFPIDRFNFLSSLKNYNLFVLSNTNSIHEVRFRKIIDQSVGWKNFAALFEGIGYSHELKARKPDEIIFQKIMEKYRLEPGETLFIDDTIDHVLTARSLNIRAVHLEKGKEISEVLPEYLS